MDDHRIDALSTHIAASLSRRASLLGLAGAALAAASAAPASAGKAGKKVKKTCKKQIGQCESSVAAFCADAPVEGCEPVLLPCCASFKGCKAGTAYGCIVDALLELFQTDPE
jgi:hypothetical protein